MWLLLCPFTCLAFIILGAAAFDVCPENDSEFRISPGDTMYGHVSSPTGESCARASLQILVPPTPPNLLLLTGGWNYLFGAVVEDRLPATVAFSILALCDGVEVCRADFRYDVDPNASMDDAPLTPMEPPTTTTTTEAPMFLPCAVSQREYQLMMMPGRTNIATLPTSAVQMACPGGFQAAITQPVIGSAAVLDPDSMQFAYASPDDDVEANVTLPYKIKCDNNVICAGVMRIWLHENVSRCLNDELLYNVKPGVQLSATLDAGASCDGVLRARLRNEKAAKVNFHDGLLFTFNGSDKEEDVVVDARLYCDDEALCDVTFAVVVTSEPRPNSTEAPHPGPTPSPTEAPVAMCDEQFNFTVPVGTELRGRLHVDLEGCGLVTYHQPLYRSSKNLQINIVGDFFYAAPAVEGVAKFPVDVSCVMKFQCRTYVVITSYIDLTPTEGPTTPSTKAPVRACANVYYYQTTPGTAFSDSLNGMPGQDPCAYGRYFSMINPPSAGKLDLAPIGDFLYRPDKNQGAYHFSFEMHCLNKPYCQGNAYILVSNEWTLPPSGGEHGDSTPAPSHPSEVKNKQIKCRGTCNEKAWKTYPKPALWDNSPGAGYTRRDGHAVDGIQVAWINNSIIITLYTIIGNLGVRFPTFEPLNRTVGKYFEPKDFEGVVEPASLGFELSCLASQGSVGMGEDVWRWKMLGNGTGTGSVGALYNKGTSWYQKFGGKHIGCDTFVDSCRYAPLLTPAAPNTTAVGRWEIEIDDCDATWTGTFPYASLEQLKKSDGSPVWYFIGDKQIKGTIISEGVRASSWIEPARSFDAQYGAHDVIFDLQQFIVVNKLATAPFSIDSEFFEYTENGDRAFGVNLLLHPYVTKDMETSYAADRHVEGFKWISQDWVAPSAQQCVTCKGNKSHCTAEGKYATSTYTGEFPSGDCPFGTSRVELRKGPAMDGSTCRPNRMHVYNRSGFSGPTGCATWYQNLTIRGVSIGSGALPDALKRAFSYEGRVKLQLLMTDGTKHDVAMDLSMYVARLSQDSYAAAGHLGVCRGSDYWPVLDPLGASRPDKPFELSTATPGPLCIDTLSSTFGPSGWATVFLQIPGVLASQVNVHTIVLKYQNTSVFLHYQDPTTGAAAMPPKTLGYWWQRTHPFLSFRPLINGVTNGTITTGPGVNPSDVADVPFAFAFIPGAISIATNVEIILTATITTDIVSISTFRRMIHVDPMMTQWSRYGPPPKAGTEAPNNIRKNALEVGVFAGLSIALTITGIVYMTMDNNRPLPRWVPRGRLIKDTVLAAVPAGLRPTKKKKRIVHKDMYDAMKSGRY